MLQINLTKLLVGVISLIVMVLVGAIVDTLVFRSAREEWKKIPFSVKLVHDMKERTMGFFFYPLMIYLFFS